MRFLFFFSVIIRICFGVFSTLKIVLEFKLLAKSTDPVHSFVKGGKEEKKDSEKDKGNGKSGIQRISLRCRPTVLSKAKKKFHCETKEKKVQLAQINCGIIAFVLFSFSVGGGRLLTRTCCDTKNPL